MKKLRKKIYMAAGYNTLSMGTGRKEFHPLKPRPTLEDYLKEAGSAFMNQVGGSRNVDDCVIGNFMASRFNKQANLPGFFPMIDPGLRFKPACSVEGACASGGLALITGIKSVLSDLSDLTFVLGFEVQNTVKAIYGADILAGAGWFPKRKEGHAYFFPGQFSNRAGAYFEKFGRDNTRRGFATWYINAIENARLCPTAQEYQNTNQNLEETGLKNPDGSVFTEHLNYADCSKVSDGASAIGIFSEEGLKKAGIQKKDAIEVVGFAQVEEDITQDPIELTRLTTMEEAIRQAFISAGISKDDLATVETHDCFTIAGIMSVEALGFAKHGQGPDFVIAGETSRSGKIPMNTTGGLIGWGHPVGATGVHQAVTIWEQLTGKAGKAQIQINPKRPYGMTINMGGDDKTLVAIVYKIAE